MILLFEGNGDLGEIPQSDMTTGNYLTLPTPGNEPGSQRWKARALTIEVAGQPILLRLFAIMKNTLHILQHHFKHLHDDILFPNHGCTSKAHVVFLLEIPKPVLYSQKQNWSSAATFCRNTGSHLASYRELMRYGTAAILSMMDEGKAGQIWYGQYLTKWAWLKGMFF